MTFYEIVKFREKVVQKSNHVEQLIQCFDIQIQRTSFTNFSKITTNSLHHD